MFNQRSSFEQGCTDTEVKKVNDFLKSKGKRTFESLDDVQVLAVSKQVVAGMNYLFKLKVDEETECKVKIFKALPCNGGAVTVQEDNITL